MITECCLGYKSDGYSNSARISSEVVLTLLPLLLAPDEGGVARSGGSRYDKSSMGSTILSGRSCKI